MIAAAVLLAAAASAETLVTANAELRLILAPMQAALPRHADPGSVGRPAVVVALDPLLDNMRRTSVAFRAGGSMVRLFGDKSQNKKSWFVGFQEDGRDEAQFRKGEKMLNWSFVFRGEQEVVLGGRTYRVKLHGQARNRMNSRLVIEPKDGGEGKAVFTVKQVSEGVFEAGHPVRLGERDFRLLYTRNFIESERGEFGGYSGDRSVVLMFRQGDKLLGYHWFERAIPTGRVLISTPRAADEDDGRRPGGYTLGLRINERRELELYPQP